MERNWLWAGFGAGLMVTAAFAAVGLQGEGPKKPVAGGEVAKAPGTPLRLLRTRELRQTYEPGVNMATTPGLSQGLPGMGNWLMLDMDVPDAGEKVRVVSVEYVSATARDELGNDLVGPAMDRVKGQDPRRFIERWNEQTLVMHDFAPAVCWYLNAPPRAAKSLDVNVIVKVELSERREVVEVKGDRQWHDIEHPSLAGMKVRARVVNEGEGWSLVMEPRAAAKYLMAYTPRPPQFGARAKWSSADRNGVRYLLAKGYDGETPVRLEIHSGLRTVEAELSLEKHPLPE